jgi:hypothetical protein
MYVLLHFRLTLAASDEEAEEFCLQIAEGKIRSAAPVVDWVAERLQAIG